MTTYPASMENADGTVRIAGQLDFTSTSNQPALNAPPITSGTLPNTGAWVSGTAKVNPVTRPITVAVEIVGAATNTIASCTVAISPDNSTYTTLATPSLAAPFATRVPIPSPRSS